MKKRIPTILLILVCLFLPFSVNAQEETLQISFTRDWGYGGFAGEIQGRFSLRVTGPASLVEVRFLIDGTPMATLTAPPYNFQFTTDAYPPGQHTLTAVGILADGTQITGPEFTRVFLSAEQAQNATYQFLVPMLVGLGGLILLATVLPVVLLRKNPYKFKQYGLAGGAVCKRCLLPFSRNVFSPNMFFGKLERCPHCGKWAIVRSATPQELEEAENRYTQGETILDPNVNDQAERLKKALDETRYE